MFASIQKNIIQRTAHRLVTQNVRNASSLVVAEHNNASLGEATFSAIAAAAQLGERTVLVGGKDCGKVAEEVAKCKGVTKVTLFIFRPIFLRLHVKKIKFQRPYFFG